MNRRTFLSVSMIGAAAAAVGVVGGAQTTSGTGSMPASLPTTRKGDMPYRRLGRTNETVSLLGLGGHHIGIPDSEQESIRIIRTAIDRGLTFMDNCWDYHEGLSELRMGKALRDGHRLRCHRPQSALAGGSRKSSLLGTHGAGPLTLASLRRRLPFRPAVRERAGGLKVIGSSIPARMGTREGDGLYL